MTPLQEKIIRLITIQGPIEISRYMLMATADPEYGYYRTANPFGREGDFITAPETSQMFGEMVAIWALATWQNMGSPAPFLLCEAGPGRGTLMDDILRTIGKLVPQYLDAARVILVETSPRLAAAQKEKLKSRGIQVQWVGNVEELAGLPLILIANELFDVLPIHQYVSGNGAFRERMISVDENGSLCFSLEHYPIRWNQITGRTMRPIKTPERQPDSTGSIGISGSAQDERTLMQAEAPDMPDGTVIEVSPARMALARQISAHIVRNRGAALIIDYGALETGFGDTLQAMSKHSFRSPLENPGDYDLTSHVNFAALARAAHSAGCHTAALTQGDFLINLGLPERAGRLGADKDETFRQQVVADVERLAAPERMGGLFKVLCIADPRTTMPPFPWETSGRNKR